MGNLLGHLYIGALQVAGHFSGNYYKRFNKIKKLAQLVPP
jgi:hypothetical protein